VEEGATKRGITGKGKETLALFSHEKDLFSKKFARVGVRGAAQVSFCCSPKAGPFENQIVAFHSSLGGKKPPHLSIKGSPRNYVEKQLKRESHHFVWKGGNTYSETVGRPFLRGRKEMFISRGRREKKKPLFYKNLLP